MALADLGKFDAQDTTGAEFQQCCRDRIDDFNALRAAGRWTASVYMGPYVVELRLKYLICDHLRTDRLPTALRIHELSTLLIYAGRHEEFGRQPTAVRENFQKVISLQSARWRYRVHDPVHKADSDNLNDWLFNDPSGIMKWVGV